MRLAVLAGFLAFVVQIAGAAPVAAATILTVTYEGTVTRASGNLRPFGAANEDLVGMDYVAVYRFDIDRGRHSTSETFESAAGGIALDEETPGLSATLTINGRTASFGGNYRGVVSVANAGYFAVTGARMEYVHVPLDPNRGELAHSVNTTRLNTTISTRLSQPFTYLIDPSDTVSANYTIQEAGPSGCCQSSSARLSPRSVTFAVAAVPEPDAWALMLIGFGFAGTWLRRRGSAASATA